MPDNTLRVGYAGSLKGHVPGQELQPWWRPIADWVWTFRNRSLQHHTRSGYFLLRGVQTFGRKYPELRSRLQIELWGLIEEVNKRQVEAFGVADMVSIGGYFSKGESAEKLAACDLAFLPLETAADPLFIPGKVFDYMRTGKPVLVLGPESDCTRILDRAGLGIRLKPEDDEGIADQLKRLIEQKAVLSELFQVDAAYVQENFHFANLSQKMAAVFEELSQEG